jgi:hypothetical protein
MDAVRAELTHLGLPRLIRTNVTPSGATSRAARQYHVNKAVRFTPAMTRRRDGEADLVRSSVHADRPSRVV